jgi:hypothetical protein
VLSAKKRYEVGLEKLAFTAEQVVVMQGELTALKPNLITTVAETERLMATVQKEKTEVRAWDQSRSKIMNHFAFINAYVQEVQASACVQCA